MWRKMIEMQRDFVAIPVAPKKLPVHAVKIGDAKEQKAVFFDNSEGEYAKIEDGKLIFPMSEWNYRMIVIWEEE